MTGLIIGIIVLVLVGILAEIIRPKHRIPKPWEVNKIREVPILGIIKQKKKPENPFDC